jgi:hypothetical protein
MAWFGTPKYEDLAWEESGNSPVNNNPATTNSNNHLFFMFHLLEEVYLSQTMRGATLPTTVNL